MQAIWKWQLQLYDGPQQLDVPIGGRVVRFAMQGANPTLWILVDTDRKTEQRAFAIYGTGAPIRPNSDYVGSCVHGPFIWHCFEATESQSGLPERCGKCGHGHDVGNPCPPTSNV